MKKFFLFLTSAILLASCESSPEDYEKSYSGTWEEVGSAEMDWKSIKNMRNYKLAKAIDKSISSENILTLVFGNKRFELSGNDLSSGSYSIDKDGTVSVEWDDEGADVYWMYNDDDYLYMIEFGLDEDGELSKNQLAFKFRRVSN